MPAISGWNAAERGQKGWKQQKQADIAADAAAVAQPQEENSILLNVDHANQRPRQQAASSILNCRE